MSLAGCKLIMSLAGCKLVMSLAGCKLVMSLAGCMLVMSLAGCKLVMSLAGCKLVMSLAGCKRVMSLAGCQLVTQWPCCRFFAAEDGIRSRSSSRWRRVREHGFGAGLNSSSCLSSFALSASLHQCCIIFFISVLILPEGQAGETWEFLAQRFFFQEK
jgi:hypothetical protein